MPCECIEQMDAKLADHNTKLSLTLGFTGEGTTFVLPTITTEKIEKRVRKGPAIAVPTFCPFCGVPYQPQPAAPKPEGGAA
ncbi:hypothetical protein [Microcystis phage Mae-JY29]